MMFNTQDLVEITEDAKTEILTVLEKYPGKGLRVVIAGVGWGGPRLGLALDELKSEDVQVFNQIDVMIDEQTKQYLSPSVIECYKNELNGCGLMINSKYSSC